MGRDPAGYAILGIKGGKVSYDYFPARLPADRQMALHVPEAVAPRQGYVSFYANVFSGYEGWTVEARVDGRAWNSVNKVLGWDPSYAAEYLAQDGMARPRRVRGCPIR